VTYSSIIKENLLLKTLDPSENISFFSKLQLIPLLRHDVLLESGQTLDFSYFPTTAVISSVYESSANTWLERESIRNDGMFGLPLVMDSLLSSHAVVQSSGYAYSIETNQLEQEAKNSKTLFLNLLKYQQLRMEKISQIAVCSRFHSIEQQFCRILLDTLDHSFTDLLEITQQTLASKLNVRRESVTLCVANLQHAGVINTRRGRIMVLDRAALEKRVCECYRVITEATDTLFNTSNPKAKPTFNRYMDSQPFTAQRVGL
jgi:CRP-like cAMP-binding protein